MNKRYCKHCGTVINCTKEIDSYDRLSGKAVFKYRMICPTIEEDVNKFLKGEGDDILRLDYHDGTFKKHDIYTIKNPNDKV